ncbi:MAG: anti-sigma factor, partial [Parvularcula sp.]|nr:anti-sigma factor [Parvularcula sp.]
ETRQSGILQSLGLWRLTTALFSGLSALLAFIIVVEEEPQTVQQDERLFVVLLSPTSDSRSPTPAVLRSRDGFARISIPNLEAAAPIEEPATSDRQLWLIEEGRDPVSLGLLPDGDVVEVALNEELTAALSSGVTIAVSLEPSGGSPTGVPTGPVLATGALTAL